MNNWDPNSRNYKILDDQDDDEKDYIKIDASWYVDEPKGENDIFILSFAIHKSKDEEMKWKC